MCLYPSHGNQGINLNASPIDSFDELESIIAPDLSDPAWPAALLNDILLTLHARFKASPDMAVTLLEIARVFATKVPGKVDADVLQLLWKITLEAVTIVLDLPPPQPGTMLGLTSVDRVSASDPKSALALQRLVQAAVWFLGENANYAASEYAWESATPPGTALMMLDAEKMVAAASSRNPTLAGALTRLQRCAFSGSWEIRIIIARALTTMTIGSNQGASGTGLGVLLSSMIRVLDEMYRPQDDLIKEIRNHDNAKKEWSDDELKKLYETHERLFGGTVGLVLVGVHSEVATPCFIVLLCSKRKTSTFGPNKVFIYSNCILYHLAKIGLVVLNSLTSIRHAIGLSDPAVASGISDFVYESKPALAESDTLDDLEDDARPLGSSSPDSTRSVET
ncbi:hypothetical protein L6164_028379 [Bauhinia variegata]|uniref:Uncharacterized protein n=1 Tax=Bauhinia variegata TaxID=167791 RepID=A0ACB9LX80_BAUVA|nr:hypothetical protein L6164_028379 [Bauhinia variegata]